MKSQEMTGQLETRRARKHSRRRVFAVAANRPLGSRAKEITLIVMLSAGLSIASSDEALSNSSPSNLPAQHRIAASPKPAPRQAAAVRNTAAASSAFRKESKMNPRTFIDRWQSEIDGASKRVNIPSDWIRAVMMEESAGRTMMAENTPITSSMGAMGLMQVMPDTWREMQQIYKLGNDPYAPHDNILAGAALLRTLYWEYGYPGLFAAYNDGPGMIEAHRRLKQMLPPETAAYVLDIASILRTGARNAPWAPAKLNGSRASQQSQIASASDKIQMLPTQDYPNDDDDYYQEK